MDAIAETTVDYSAPISANLGGSPVASWLLSAFLVAGMGNTDCTIVQFTATWCEPCKRIQPDLERLRSEGWDIRPVDVDQAPHLVQQFNVQNLPTLVFVSGGREVDRIVGVANYDQIQRRASRVAARAGQHAGGVSSRAGETHPSLNGAKPSRSESVSAPAPTGSQPIVRGQSPGLRAVPGIAANVVSAAQQAMQNTRALEPPTAPQLSPQQAIARAAAATVRIRVDEGNTTAYGTGTIVDVHGSEALVLTCGHLFRNIQPNSQLSVDLFAGTAQETSVTAQLIDFTAEEADIGLVSIQLPIQIEPVSLIPKNARAQTGDPAFSFGCDHGSDPTRRDTRITNVNRYLGAANIEIMGAPAVGRSGGGLFDMQGRLIGVCNAADATDDRGIYAAADVIYAQIDRLGLTHLFAQESSPANRLAPQNAAQTTSSLAASLQTTPSRAADSTSTTHVQEFFQATESSHQPTLQTDSPSLASNHAASQQPPGTLICILRGSDGRNQVVTIDAPTASLMRQIQEQSNSTP